MDGRDKEAEAGRMAAGPQGSTEPEAPASSPASLGRSLLRFLLPARCFACREPLDAFLSGGVCADCWRALPRPDPTRCVVCDEPLPAPARPRCGRCLLDPPAFDRLQAAAPYRDGARRILLALKFAGADYLAPRLSELIVERLAPAPEVDCVVAVPAWRRFGLPGPRHAADLLARAVARRLARPQARLLKKTRATRRQSGLPLSRRAQNVRGAYRVACAVPNRVLLVDDVATSGATARACAAALKKAGAEIVIVWCFARASRS